MPQGGDYKEIKPSENAHKVEYKDENKPASAASKENTNEQELSAVEHISNEAEEEEANEAEEEVNDGRNSANDLSDKVSQDEDEQEGSEDEEEGSPNSSPVKANRAGFQTNTS